MWMSEYEISKAMYYKCQLNDKKEYWSHITNSEWAYMYCKNIRDLPTVRKHIIEPQYAYYYCRVIDDPEIRNNITNSEYAYWYCYFVKDREEIRDRIIDPKYAYFYCLDIKKDPEVEKRLNISDIILK